MFSKIKMIFITLALALSLSANARTVTLTETNTMSLKTAFTGDSVSELMERATELDSKLDKNQPIYLFLYTPGGSIQQGLILFEFLEALDRPVHTITLFAASMGFQAVQHLGDRLILKYGVLMSHKARGGFQGEFGGGFSQLDSRYSMWLKRIDIMDKITVERTDGKQTLKDYRSAYDNELWLNGQEAVRKGYADEVVSVKCDSTLNGIESSSISFMGMSFSVAFSKCPIKVNPLDIKTNIVTNQGEMSLNDFLSKGGQFGKDCLFNNSSYSKKLCASNPDLTLKDVELKKLEVMKDFSKDLKDNVEYSY